MKGIRVAFDPIITEEDSRKFISGASLRLEALGKGRSKLRVGESAKAKLHFMAGFLGEVRDQPDPEFSQFASISGEIKGLSMNQLEFTLDSPEIEYHSSSGESEVLPREIALLLGDSFVNASQDMTLILPVEPEDSRFMEVAVELEINGSTESSASENDRLDLSLKNFIEVILLDEDDLPISGVGYTINACSHPISGKLNEEGFTRLVELPKWVDIEFSGFLEADIKKLEGEDVPEEFR